jgi:hypothetical protein
MFGGINVMVFCPNCGSQVPDGLSFCEDCKASIPTRTQVTMLAPNVQAFKTKTTTFEYPFPSTPGKSAFTAPLTHCPLCSHQLVNAACPHCGWKAPHGSVQASLPAATTAARPEAAIEMVEKKPQIFTVREIADIFLAWLIIFLGFTARLILIEPKKTIEIITLETAIIILAIFGAWFLFEKLASRYYHLYTEFKFDGNRAAFAFFVSFIFIGIPPGHNKYKVHVTHPPKVADIPKIQSLCLGTLLIWGIFIQMGLIILGAEFLLLIRLEELLYIPFIIALTVGINLLPFYGTPGYLIKSSNILFYVLLFSVVIILFFTSFNYIVHF